MSDISRRQADVIMVLFLVLGLFPVVMHLLFEGGCIFGRFGELFHVVSVGSACFLLGWSRP